jgi:hypothetical protein
LADLAALAALAALGETGMSYKRMKHWLKILKYYFYFQLIIKHILFFNRIIDKDWVNSIKNFTTDGSGCMVVDQSTRNLKVPGTNPVASVSRRGK